LDLSPGFLYFGQQLEKLFVSSGSVFSATSLLSALLISALLISLRRYRRNRRVRLKTIVRALFPKRILRNRSNIADLGYVYFHVFVFGLTLGWAILSYQFLTNGTIDLLVATFGPRSETTLPELVTRSIITLLLFLGYELGYWINHYLSHRVPFLWEFHKVHHSATVLTPLTVFRVHPVYMLVFANILAVAAALTNGLANYLFGNTAYQYALSDTNIILVVFLHTWGHLQHSHMWISFPGVLGRILLSPAHHQVHHSTNPVHFNKNMGSVLAVWDWMFGTLYIPGKEREPLSYGVEPDRPHAHTFRGEFLAPFHRGGVIAAQALARTSQTAAALLVRRPAASRADVRRDEPVVLPRSS
jgi:sterol desaturase/sphingolipid hydroxylase (fatty acid hydroxylase superfamily)